MNTGGEGTAAVVEEGLEPRTQIDAPPKWRKKAPRPHSGSRTKGREAYGSRWSKR